MIKKVEIDANSIKHLELDPAISSTEGYLYKISLDEKEAVLKGISSLNYSLYHNKIYTINRLFKYRNLLPDELCLPEALGSFYGELIGFIMPYIKGQNLSLIMDNNTISHQKKIAYLKQIGLVLEKIKKCPVNMHVGDLHLSNFIVDKKDCLKVVDMDSCKIDDNISFLAKYLNPLALLNNVDKYIKSPDSPLGYFEVDENTDIYCYVITILSYLFDRSVNGYSISEYHTLLNYLSDKGFNKELIDVLSKIIEPTCPNINPYQYLDTVDEKQLFISRSFHIKRNKL